MRFLPLLLANLGRRKLRTTLTLLSVVTAFLLYGLLVAIEQAFSLGVDISGADRLVMTHKVSLIQPLPASYEARIEQVEGVVDATHASWFGGTYQDPRNFFPRYPVEPEEYLAMYPEIELPPEQREAWLATRTGAVAGRTIADRYGWEIGDQIPLVADIWPRKDGDSWTFDLVGIYDAGVEGFDTTQFLFRYDYFDEARAYGEGLVGWYMIRIADPEAAPRIAEAIDARFANSPAETKTATEKAFAQAFANQIGDVGAIAAGIVGAVFFTILLVAGTTMAQAVRERTGELGVLKAVGFSSRAVLGLVLAESLLLAVVGGIVGLALALWLLPALEQAFGELLPVTRLPVEELAAGVGWALLVGVAAGILPALAAMRLPVADALRRS